MRPWLSVALTGLLLVACGADSSTSASAMAPEELAERIQAGSAPLILDVRTPEEYEKGHIPGAVNVPHDQLASRVDELDLTPSREVVVHCHSGKRAAMAEETLRTRGFENVRDLTGHWVAWQESGRPVE